jgi:predicted transcriptional regulator of viral defense system
MGAEFRFITSGKDDFFGLADHWINKQEKIKVSDPERTVMDGLRMPEYCGGVTELARGIWIKKQELNDTRLIDY